MKVLEIWTTARDGIIERGDNPAPVASAFASGVRAAAVELLTQAKDVVSDEDAGKLYARLMAAADRIDTAR